MNALIIETAFLGDAIVSLGLAREIKRIDNSHRVTYLVRSGIGETIAASPDVDEVLTFDKHGSENGMKGIEMKAEEIETLNFDTLFLLHSSRRSQELANRLHIKRKIGFEGMSHADLSHSVADAGWTNRYERAILLLRAILPNADLHTLPRINPQKNSTVEEFRQRWEKTVTLAPGSAWETKQWGNDKFLSLARILTQRGIGVIVIGGASERVVGDSVRSLCPENSVLDLAGRTSFLDSMTAIKASSLLVSNDSAPVHAAVAVGTKILAIFGPTSPSFGFAPPKGCGESIELSGLWCRPCTPHGSHTCPIYTHECMRGLTVEAVLDRVEAML